MWEKLGSGSICTAIEAHSIAQANREQTCGTAALISHFLDLTEVVLTVNDGLDTELFLSHIRQPALVPFYV